MEKTAELNLIIDAVTYRDPPLWIDQPPAERNLEIGIGWHAAWQSPLHREAVRRALESAREGRAAEAGHPERKGVFAARRYRRKSACAGGTPLRPSALNAPRGGRGEPALRSSTCDSLP